MFDLQGFAASVNDRFWPDPEARRGATICQQSKEERTVDGLDREGRP